MVMKMDLIYEFQMLDFKNRMLQAEITMQGMIAENKIREFNGMPLVYNRENFLDLIREYGIGTNQVPSYCGG